MKQIRIKSKYASIISISCAVIHMLSSLHTLAANFIEILIEDFDETKYIRCTFWGPSVALLPSKSSRKNSEKRTKAKRIKELSC